MRTFCWALGDFSWTQRTAGLTAGLRGSSLQNGCDREASCRKGPDVIVQGRKRDCFVGKSWRHELLGLPGSIKADWACWTNFKWNSFAVLDQLAWGCAIWASWEGANQQHTGPGGLLMPRATVRSVLSQLWACLGPNPAKIINSNKNNESNTKTRYDS